MEPELIDYTKRRLGSIQADGRKISKCPKCGRKGTVSHYKDGSGMCAHSVKDCSIMLLIVDKCEWNKPK